MDFNAALEYMGTLLRFGWKPGNDRISELARLLGNPHLKVPAIHIAGTKGKGSTTALTAAILKEAGFVTGAYFSPYVYNVRERIQLNGDMLTEKEFADLVTEIKPFIEKIAQTPLGQTTEFELKTIMGFCHFANSNADYSCIEVGLGGRLDATNILQPEVSVITNIGLDHTELLGDTHSLIAAEKAGIIKTGVECITATHNMEALDKISEIARSRDSKLYLVEEEQNAKDTPFSITWKLTSKDDPHASPVTITTPNKVYRDLHVKLPGIYQRENAACAVAAAELALSKRSVTLTENTVRRALANTTLPGRMETVYTESGTALVLDGAHNALAAEALAGAVKALLQREERRDLHIVLGMLHGHAPEGVITALAPMAKTVICCQPTWKRALPYLELMHVANKYHNNVMCEPDVVHAVDLALNIAGPEDMVLVTGSFYTVGQCESLVKKIPCGTI